MQSNVLQIETILHTIECCAANVQIRIYHFDTEDNSEYLCIIPVSRVTRVTTHNK